MFKGNTCISINILSQKITTVTSRVKIVYLTGCVNIYPKDGQDWLHFRFKTHHITISSIIPHRLHDFNLLAPELFF